MTKQLDIEGNPVYVPIRMSAEMKNDIAQLSKTWDYSMNRTVVELIQMGLDNVA